jgi:hypothetical protein
VLLLTRSQEGVQSVLAPGLAQGRGRCRTHSPEGVGFQGRTQGRHRCAVGLVRQSARCEHAVDGQAREGELVRPQGPGLVELDGLEQDIARVEDDVGWRLVEPQLEGVRSLVDVNRLVVLLSGDFGAYERVQVVELVALLLLFDPQRAYVLIGIPLPGAFKVGMSWKIDPLMKEAIEVAPVASSTARARSRVSTEPLACRSA